MRGGGALPSFPHGHRSPGQITFNTSLRPKARRGAGRVNLCLDCYEYHGQENDAISWFAWAILVPPRFLGFVGEVLTTVRDTVSNSRNPGEEPPKQQGNQKNHYLNQPQFTDRGRGW